MPAEAGNSGRAATESIARPACPSAQECDRWRSSEDGCCYCRACWHVFSEPRENTYGGRGRA